MEKAKVEAGAGGWAAGVTSAGSAVACGVRKALQVCLCQGSMAQHKGQSSAYVGASWLRYYERIPMLILVVFCQLADLNTSFAIRFRDCNTAVIHWRYNPIRKVFRLIVSGES